ncbi:SipW-dependent-type signal peptide-containing protein [uncultured Williamsia sp.]|uniref:SipW-dependent-type signal peptide-containing protein n=1 Tax=uncultured Williamsia sp. TaxID=259311 RepID=UPI00262E7C00|nr:SipW-dependent-type signal peptide-containing protein [uncultured Williamsia sp.]
MNRVLAAAISRRTRALLSIGMVVGISVVGTLALWSSTVSTRSGVFTTATINLLADGAKASTFTFTPSGLLPGQSAAKVVAVTNTGTAPLTYSAAVSSPDSLGRAMTLTVVAGATAANGVCGSGTLLTSGTAITATATTFATNRGPLAATNGAENLCVQVGLPLAADASLAGTAGSVALTFTGSAGT